MVYIMNRVLSVVILGLSCVSRANADPPQDGIALVDAKRLAKLQEMLDRLPQKKMAGVDLRWHADLAVNYATSVLHEKADGRPLYAN